MKRMMALELKRVAKSRATLVLAAMALMLSIAMAFLVISFARYYYPDETGEEAALKGMAAIRARSEMAKPIEGQVTPEKIKAVYETYREVYDAYGDDIPLQESFEKISPVSTILFRVREVYVNSATGVPVPLHEVSPDDAADFYARRTERLRDIMANDYKDAPAAQQQALAMNEKVETPFTYVYGIGDSDTDDYLTFCIFLLVMICVVITAPIFAGEYQSGADDILRCTRYGRRRLAVVKLLSAILLTTVLFAVCVTVFLLIPYAAFGRESLKTSIQIVRSAVYFTPLTVGGAQTLTALAGLLSFLATICFTLLLSSRFNTSLTALAASIGACLLPTVLWMAGSGANIENWLKFCLPSGGVGLGNSFYFELTGLNFLQLGPLSVWSPYVIAVAAGIEMFLFFFLAIRSYCRHEAA
ncbi:MAG TPA: ABC transporter permease subunit [Feifaniaceae bacterium]|nr:ABC transporter permease subunit [Feifaniaceae bacterium]